MKIVPLNDKILVERLEADDKTAGGIILPDTAKEKPQVGKVVEVGPGKLLDDGKRCQMSVKKNDEVIYGKYAGNEIEIEGDKYVILRESDLLGIVDK